jgi:hypothetical protein
MLNPPPPALAEFGLRLSTLGWVSDLLVAGSLATGDYLPGISDFDLVALSDGPVDQARQAALTAVHQDFAEDLNLGCVYVDAGLLPDLAMEHPTWTHGVLVERILSLITRAELVRHGYAVLGRAPGEVLPAMSDDDLREAARAELTGYWAWAARRPAMWLNPIMPDLGLTAMARGRHTLRTGELLTKSAAIEQAAAPAWLIEQLRARRHGSAVTSPRLRTALIAWRDAHRTTRQARLTPPA